MASHPLNTDIANLDLTQAFNIGAACTKPDIADFDVEQDAIIVDHTDGLSTSLSYKSLNHQSNQFAHWLNSQGIKKGDRVMLWLPNVAAFPIAFFGSLKAGAIAVPSSIMLTSDEIEYLAKDSEARVLITNNTLFSKLSEEVIKSVNFEYILLTDEPSAIAHESGESQKGSLDKNCTLAQFNQEIQDYEGDHYHANTTYNDPAYLVYTSGTTGYPKGVLHAHRALLGRLPAARRWFNYDEVKTDRILHSGKFNWTYVLGTALMDPLFLGKTVIVYEGDSNASIWPKLIAKHSASIFIGVPTIYRQIIQKTEYKSSDVPTLRHCMSAGEHLSNEMLCQWKARFGQEIYEAIGMSECSYYLSQHPSRPVVAGSAGCPQPGHKVYLLDENLKDVADNQEGMLCIREDDLGLFLEYWKLPETTSAAKRQGYFLTGDYAKRDENGYFWFLGRKDDIINSFGFRISPMEIERVIKAHPAIADAVALEENVGVDKNIVTVCAILKPGEEVTEKVLLEYSSEHLAAYKVPKRIVFVDAFPRTANGKILRKAMQAALN